MMHGLALNVHTDLSDFRYRAMWHRRRPVTSVAEQLRAAGTSEEDLPTLTCKDCCSATLPMCSMQLVEAAPDEGETQVPSGLSSSCVLHP